MTNTTPAFNLKAVLHETGIAADTLRAWERRYGLPMPERTPGGHRLYSQRDIETVKWLMARQEEGLSISRAVDLWNELTSAGRDPLAESRDQASPTLTALPGASSLDALREAWLKACLDFDEAEGEHILNQAIGVYPIEQVCTQVMQRGLAELGELWYRNQASVQQEHFASALAQRRLDTLIASTPPPTRSESIMIGCAPNEHHSFAPLMLTLLLRRRGLRVFFLGANVPLTEFEKAVSKIVPTIIILSAQQLHTTDDLLHTIEYLQMTGRPLAYGGRIFNLLPELRERIPAYFIGETLEYALENIEKLLAARPSMPTAAVLASQPELFQNFRNRRLMVEFHLMTEINEHELPFRSVQIAIQSLGDAIEAALAFGDLGLVSIEFEWVRGLMEHHGVEPSMLKIFWEAYAAAVDKSMYLAGNPISTWLRQKVEQFT